MPKTDKLKQLIDIVNYYKQLEDNAKTIGNFLETVKKLNQLLETPKSENKLENLLNHLNYIYLTSNFPKKKIWLHLILQNGLTIYLPRGI
ncbi:hypothetical protein [Rickettsia sibirica]|uniref:hypothetical protein n=1 Tax=Rickettsia sibirica TaxID=35793 RepID=UPI00036421F8